jgi:hypothetical protein
MICSACAAGRRSPADHFFHSIADDLGCRVVEQQVPTQFILGEDGVGRRISDGTSIGGG